MSPLRKLTYFIKLVILDDIFIFRNSVMPGHQLVEKNKNLAKRGFFDCVSFRSGLNNMVIFFKPVQLLLVLISISSFCLAQAPIAQNSESSMALKKADANGITWFNPWEKPFNLVGFEWFKEDSVFRRLPLHPMFKLPIAVSQLANNTAGGQIRFKTNSKKILVKVELWDKFGMYHMAATGRNGFDLYIGSGDVQKYLKTTWFPLDTLQYQVELYNATKKNMDQFMLNFPLYNGVKSILIGLEENSTLEPPNDFNISGKIVIYGTSITQGCCVSRPGMLFSNILSRRLDVEFVNLGFSGSGKGEPELAQLINQIADTKLIILDYEANTSKTIKNSLAKFVEILREKQPSTPILIVSKIRYASEITGSTGYNLLISNRDFQRDLVKERELQDDKNIYFLDGSTILGKDYDECTVDGVHPTDLGSYRIAKAMLAAIKNIWK